MKKYKYIALVIDTLKIYLSMGAIDYIFEKESLLLDFTDNLLFPSIVFIIIFFLNYKSFDSEE